MVRGILGKKVGMTQLFDDQGRVIPVTVVEAGPCVVVQRKSEGRDGYEVVQLGLVERSPRRGAPKPIQGHFANAGVPPTRFLGEVPVDSGDEAKPGDAVLADIFEVDEKVHVIGRSADPSRVFPGQGMPGQMGNKRVTVKNAEVVRVDANRNLLFLKGGIPGARNSYVRILKTV
jgi:large subunit ribosomal protein L3